jgi:hypothetical protein
VRPQTEVAFTYPKEVSPKRRFDWCCLINLCCLRAVIHTAIEHGLRGAETREIRLGRCKKNRCPADSRMPEKGGTKQRCGPWLHVREEYGKLVQNVNSKLVMQVGDMQVAVSRSSIYCRLVDTFSCAVCMTKNHEQDNVMLEFRQHELPSYRFVKSRLHQAMSSVSTSCDGIGAPWSDGSSWAMSFRWISPGLSHVISHCHPCQAFRDPQHFNRSE